MTDRAIRVLFWQPNAQRVVDLDFSAALQEISGQSHLSLYTECAGGAKIRVERLNFDEDGWVEGDFVRQQDENVPPIARQGEPLEANLNPIGHRAAFMYNIELNILAIQGARPGVSVATISSYLRRKIPNHRGFFMDPCISRDAMQRIREGTARRVELRVARPSDLGQLNPRTASIEESLANIQEFLDGQTVNIAVGFEQGDRTSVLNLERLLQMAGWAGENRGHVKKMTVKIAEEDDPIDVLAERLDRRGVIDLDPENLDAAYLARQVFVRQAFQEVAPQLGQLYG
ncbi:DUF6731 family protein [Boseongicola sp. H5]|uniref:DUF6731 family protein n=1 Tax=Boseongicola sp. H5 TaxID=2763261 RepID=UPI001D0B0BC7|nr:DUF6731 family protein [Boseongicola sp. H5]